MPNGLIVLVLLWVATAATACVLAVLRIKEQRGRRASDKERTASLHCAAMELAAYADREQADGHYAHAAELFTLAATLEKTALELCDPGRPVTARVMRESAKELESNAEQARFTAHLEDAAKEVKTWPAWKRNVLG